MDLQFLDPTGIGIKDLELHTCGMPDQFAARRHAPQHRKDQAANGVHVRFFVFRHELDV